MGSSQSSSDLNNTETTFRKLDDNIILKTVTKIKTFANMSETLTTGKRNDRMRK